MSTNYLEKLEYHKIIDELKNYCKTYLGKELAKDLSPSNQKEEVKKMLSETKEAVEMLYRSSTPPFYEINNIQDTLIILDGFGILGYKGLLDLANIFKLSNDLKLYSCKEHIIPSDYPILDNIFSNLYTNQGIIETIFKSIVDENTIDDKASNNLWAIRRKQRKLEQDIKQKLNDIIHSSSYSKYIQENVVTIRNDRFVIPVKEEHRSSVKGFIHDISSTGSTVFIEPISVFELNNELNNSKIEENIEIEKILQDLTKLFYPYIEEIKTDLELIGKLDFIFAKAKYSKNINGITPILNDEKQIHLINAKHPLIDKDVAVPISVSLGIDFSVLLITGPNTGGKTVTLKTIGLLSCMACSGLNIPASENSSIYVFDKIFADIGDDQSISDSLSTFSSHMLNIVDITKNANENSLILVDELGSGTDPLEGAHLAISILEYFKILGSLVVSTTHYQELKKYALVSDGFENASVEFDINTLSPTYRLLVGIPGKSNAFEISKKLGLPVDIIDTAKSMLSNQDIDIEELLKNIYDDKAKIEKEKTEIENELEKVSNLRKDLEKDNFLLKQQEQELIQNAKVKARNILLDAKEEANEIIQKINETSISNKDVNNLRNRLNDKIKNLGPNILSNNVSNNTTGLNESDIKINDQVFVNTLNQDGTIVSNVSKSGTVQVQIGSMKTNIAIKDLQKTKSSSTSNNTVSNNSYTRISKSKNVKTEINVIGYNVEEAIFVVDKFLDDCALTKLQTARIVHGKGTGKLKNGIHQFLKNHPHVKSYRMGTFGEGEMGVTVVEIS